MTMPRLPPLTARERQAIFDLHAEGLSRNEIARRTGRNTQTVSKTCAAAGLTFDRGKAAAMIEARKVDLRAARVRLIERAYERASSIFDRLEAPTFEAVLRAAQGAEQVAVLTFVPTRDERDLADAISRHLAAAANTAKIDNDNGASEARSMLAGVEAALKSQFQAKTSTAPPVDGDEPG